MKRNIDFIDGQNLHLGSRESGCSIDHAKFRRYLKDKYNVEEAYYFLGFTTEDQQDLCNNLQKSGYILSFRDHSSTLIGKKKGNVDCDIIFTILKMIIDNEIPGKIVLVSGDGDYKKLVDYLVKKNIFEKILFPNKKFASSLYKKLGSEYYDYFDNTAIQAKICQT